MKLIEATILINVVHCIYGRRLFWESKNYSEKLDKFIQSVPESVLDANRSIIFSHERIFIPKRIPKLSKQEKFELIFQQSKQMKEQNHEDKQPISYVGDKQKPLHAENETTKKRRALEKSIINFPEKPWRLNQPLWIKPNRPVMAVTPKLCPAKFDALTQSTNRRIYMFSNELVYEIYRRDGLQQKSVFRIVDVFPDGPPHVNAAFTNRRSGITVLIDYRTVYRYAWNMHLKQFVKTKRKQKHILPSQVDFFPTLAFQWIDGNMVLTDGTKFVTYDPYWNIVRFSAKIKDYFPNIPNTAIGFLHMENTKGRNLRTILLMSSKYLLQVYDLKKSKIVQEYPISGNEFVACLLKKLK